MDKVIKSSI